MPNAMINNTDAKQPQYIICTVINIAAITSSCVLLQEMIHLNYRPCADLLLNADK